MLGRDIDTCMERHWRRKCDSANEVTGKEILIEAPMRSVLESPMLLAALPAPVPLSLRVDKVPDLLTVSETHQPSALLSSVTCLRRCRKTGRYRPCDITHSLCCRSSPPVKPGGQKASSISGRRGGVPFRRRPRQGRETRERERESV